MTRRKIIPYDPVLKTRAKKLRENMTFSEVLLWNQLKQRKMMGFHFSRQRPIDHYIVDFYSTELQLAIEIDGNIHNRQDVQKNDKKRQRRLESLGVHFLRFKNSELECQMERVLCSIKSWIEGLPTPNPSREGNEDGPTPNPSREGNEDGMEGIIFDIKRFAIHDGPGIRVTIFFKGCPLSCWWCHNPESRLRRPQMVMREQKVNGHTFKVEELVGSEISVNHLMLEILKEKVFMDESGGGVTFSGGEPLLHPEFLIEVIKQCRKQGIHTAIDTTGYASSEVMKNVMDWPDLFLYDLKHLDDEMHKKFTGVSNKPILSNLKLLYDAGKDIVIRFPVIPGINNGKEHIEAVLSYLIKNLPQIRRLDILPYHNIARHKYEVFSIPDKMHSVKEPQQEDMEKLKRDFEKAGFEVSIGG